MNSGVAAVIIYGDKIPAINMPYLKLQTNIDLPADKQQVVIKTLSRTVAAQLGKAERYVMVALEVGTPMLFAASNEPLAYLELKSIGLPEEDTGQLSQSLCRAVNEALGVPSDRIYIEFSNAPRHLWGWDGRTF